MSRSGLWGRTPAWAGPGAGSVRRVERIDDPRLAGSIDILMRRRSGNPELLSYRNGRSWRPVGRAAINSYLKGVLARDFSAKD